MDKTRALQNLLNGTVTEAEIELLKQALASGEISIGGDLNRSVVIIGSGNKVELTAEAISQLKPQTKSEEPAEGEPPYMGLRYFDTADAALFYGREALSRELLARVSKEPFLAIVGASGSGKSSVARAGLIPAWKDENAGRGLMHVVTPTAHPLESLAASLTRDSESVTATSTLMDDLQKDVRSLRLFVRKMLSSSGKPKALLLVVDQFEETFTLCKDPEERKVFIENLLSLADEDDSAARVVLTLRADFYHHCAEFEGLRIALEKHQAYIGAMTQDELREAIVLPAEKNGWDFQPGLVDLILQDVGTEPGALPLLSHALLETWKRRQGRTLTLGGYAEAGGVKKAIAQTAENVYERLSPPEREIARNIFLRLTELGEGVQDTRRRARLDELGMDDVARKVIKTLADARLVTTEEDSAEVAHEALIREWGTLRQWLDEDRESLRLYRHVTESALEWERRGKESSELYRGARLRQMQDWVKEHGDVLSPLERKFVRASLVRLQRERRSIILRWTIVVGAGFLVTLTLSLAMTGNLNRYIYRPIDMENYWVTIPAGEFQMGSESGENDEKPAHTVYLDTYQIGRYEVTNRQYAQCVKANICSAPANKIYTAQEKELHPVTSVNWYDAKIFCEWVSGRLPTEAEWEKAAHGTDGRTYPWGENIDCSLANYYGKVNDYCVNNTMPIGSYENGRSPYGAYDMAGNVWEWVADWYSDTYFENSPLSNPLGPDSGKDRVQRGGSWSNLGIYLRSSNRGWEPADYTDSNLGFRCARDVP